MESCRLRCALPVEHLQRCGRGVAGQGRGLAKLQPEWVLALELHHHTVIDGQPVHAGHQQLARQQAALVDQTVVGVLGGAIIPC